MALRRFHLRSPRLAAVLAGAACLLLLPSHPRGESPSSALHATSGTTPQIRVRVDSGRHEIEVVAGPFHVPGMMPGMLMDQEMTAEAPVLRFTWPVDGLLTGYRADLRDSSGTHLSSEMMHHVAVVNFDRRELVYPALERTVAASKETEAVSIPSLVGLPLDLGTHLGMYEGLHNETTRAIDGVYVHLTLSWQSRRRWWGKPTLVFPFYVDVNNVIGGLDTYDIPPGVSSRSYEFQVPLSGRLVMVGGHLHDRGVSVRLEDAESGKVMVTLTAERDSAGHVLSVGRKIYALPWTQLRLQPHHRYRIVGTYDNPTQAVIPAGAMAQLMGAFVPDTLSQWPPVDATNPQTAADLATLPSERD